MATDYYDILGVSREADEADRPARAAMQLRTALVVEDHLVAARDAHLRGQLAVDGEVVEAVGAGRDTDVAGDHAVGVELDLGRAGREHQAHAGGLRLGLQHAGVATGLRPRPGGQAVGEQTVLGLLELGGTAHEPGQHLTGNPEHGPSLPWRPHGAAPGAPAGRADREPAGL